MSIRWKFLLVLLGFSLVPLLVFVTLNYRASLRLAEDAGDISRGLIIYTANKELQDAAENHARNLNREMRLAEEVLRLYAGALARRILSPSSEAIPGKRRAESGTSYLQNLMAEFHDLLSPLQEYLERPSIVLTDGPAASYPQSPDLKEETTELRAAKADGRQAADAGPAWIALAAEGRPATRAILRAILPLRAPGGGAFGSVSLDLNFPGLLEKTKSPCQWTPFMSSLLVSTGSLSARPDGKPEILAVRSDPESTSKWRAPETPIHIDAIGGGRASELLADMARWPKGYGSLPYKEETAIWAYAAAGNGFALVNILPHREAHYRLTQTEFRLRQWYALDTLLATGFVVLALTLFAYRRSRKMIDPVLSMVRAFKRLSEGDFAARLQVKARDERRMVADAFNTMAQQLEDRIRIRQALEVAKEVQQNFLPNTGLSLPGLDVATQIRYCEETGGDYIDLIPLDGRKLGVVVSDVTGHGVGAALLMATARALIRGRYGEDSKLTDMISAVNRQLAADIGETGRFMTLFFLEIDAVSRRLQWVRAGHDPAWLFIARRAEVAALDGPGIALGVDESYAYAAQIAEALQPGDLVVIGTDGLWETTDGSGALFGKQRLEALIARHSARSAADICSAVLAALDEFRGDAKQQDDVSLVVIKVRPDAA